MINPTKRTSDGSNTLWSPQLNIFLEHVPNRSHLVLMVARVSHSVTLFRSFSPQDHNLWNQAGDPDFSFFFPAFCSFFPQFI
jgi:hypothetical protein